MKSKKTKIGKVVSHILLVVLIGCLFSAIGGCNNKEPEKVEYEDLPVDIEVTSNIDNTYEYLAPHIMSDGQRYTGNGIEYPEELWDTPKFEEYPALDREDLNVKAYFYESPVKVDGKRTKIFAYMGFPQGASQTDKVPAVVLVHGGLGTAFADWVKYWNDLGFAAISMDTEGGQPKADTTMDNGNHDERNVYDGNADFAAGPTNNGFEENIPTEQMWMYHATSAVIAANSFIRSQTCVDADKVGITGISWGGVITSIVTGFDNRFLFSIPVYGTLSLYQKSFGDFLNVHKNEKNAALWDTTDILKDCTTPMLIVNSDKDYAFSVDASSRTYLAKKVNTFLTITPDLAHNQRTGATHTSVAEFAQNMVAQDKYFVKFIQEPTTKEPVIQFRNTEDVKITEIDVVYTESEKTNSSAVWQSLQQAKYNRGVVRLNVPENTKYCYVRIIYEINEYSYNICSSILSL